MSEEESPEAVGGGVASSVAVAVVLVGTSTGGAKVLSEGGAESEGVASQPEPQSEGGAESEGAASQPEPQSEGGGGASQSEVQPEGGGGGRASGCPDDVAADTHAS